MKTVVTLTEKDIQDACSDFVRKQGLNARIVSVKIETPDDSTIVAKVEIEKFPSYDWQDR